MLRSTTFRAICLIVASAYVLLNFTNTLISISSLSSSQRDAIPNIVHYTQIRKLPRSPFKLKFESFLSVYASIINLNPDAIYIHTDHTRSQIARARVNGTFWTRKILSFPQVIVHHVVAPTHVNGQLIKYVETRSDFLRWEVVYKIGGMYFDWDVLPLRDVSILREAGFNNVVGREIGGGINNGCFMSKKQTALAYLMKQEGPLAYDGQWTTHGVKLMTKISERLVRSPGEVLIMDQLAMAPTNWRQWSLDIVYTKHNESAVPTIGSLNAPEDDPINRWLFRTKSRDWEMDFSATYFFHAFKSHKYFADGFEGINLPYVLARDSNYAIAAWPIADHALRHGIISLNDTEF